MRLAVGLALEGIPGPDASKVLGVCLGYGEEMPDAGLRSWVAGLLAPPELGETTVNPLTGAWATSGMSAQFAGNDELCAILLREERRSAYSLATALTSSATEMVLTASLPGGIGAVWIGDETLRITDASLAPTYTVERGAYGSTQAAHDAGKQVTMWAPYWVPRLVTLIYHDIDSGFEWAEWRGYIDSINLRGATIALTATEFYQRWSQARANLDAPDLSTGSSLRFTGPRQIAGAAFGASRARSADGPTYLHAAGAVLRARYIASASPRHQVNESLDSLLWRAQVTSQAQRYSQTRRPNDPPDLPDRELFADAPVTTPIYEVLVWDRAQDISPTAGIDRFHPVRIAQYLLEVGGSFGLRLPIQTALFSQAINAAPDLQIDRLVLGWSGEPYRPFEVAEQLMRSYGYQPTITVDGRYGVRRFRALDVQSLFAAQDSPISPYADGPLERLSAYTSASAAIEISVGGGVPWEAPARLEILGTGASRRALLITERERTSYAIPFVESGRALDVALAFASSVELLTYSLPRLKVRVADWRVTGASYDLLQDVLLADLGSLITPWWVDAQGQRVGDLTGRIDAVGRIVGRRLLTANRTYELTLILMAFSSGTYARERGPAGVIEDVGGATIKLTNTLNSDEASFFRIGDKVRVVTRRGAPVSSVGEVTSTGANTVLTSPALTGNPGDVLRLSNGVNFTNDNPYAPLTNRAYVLLGDGNQEVRSATAIEPADPYGGGLGVI